jgi:hypothetical protein
MAKECSYTSNADFHCKFCGLPLQQYSKWKLLTLLGFRRSVPNARLYNEAFTGHARAVPRCFFCLQEDHLAQYCPRNPNRPWFGWLGDTSLQPSQYPNQQGQDEEPSRPNAVTGLTMTDVSSHRPHAGMHTGAQIAVAPILGCTGRPSRGQCKTTFSPRPPPPAGASSWSPATALLSRPPSQADSGKLFPVLTETCAARCPAGKYIYIYIYIIYIYTTAH